MVSAARKDDILSSPLSVKITLQPAISVVADASTSIAANKNDQNFALIGLESIKDALIFYHVSLQNPYYSLLKHDHVA